MSTRPLRQYYDAVDATIAPDVVPGIDHWLRHRQRFLAELGKLSDDEWRATTRCTAWDAKDVIGHLVSVDAFWVLTINAARTGQVPQKFLEHFDPSTGTDALVAATRELSAAEMLDQFAAGTATLVECIESLGSDDWDALGESPLGHLPVRFLFGHAFWDSWLHERDILVPLNAAPSSEPDETLAAVAFGLLFAGLQGGLLDDPVAVGPGLEAPIDVTLAFDDLERSLRVQYDTGVRVSFGDGGVAIPAGSAVDLVECVTGRQPFAMLERRLPGDLTAHLARTAQVL